MAKMFYTLEEAAQKLGKSSDDVKEMAKTGQLQEFRDRDKLMFKVDQVDLLASGEDPILLDAELADRGLETDASALGLVDSTEGSGISVFDADDASGETQEAAAIDEELSLESVGSGSGLLDLTRESDDTALGADLISDVYSSDDNVDMPANASGLFEAAGADSPGNTVGAAPMGGTMVYETYDGAGSGLGAGFAIGGLVAFICIGLILAVSLNGATSGLATAMADNIWMWAGGLAGVTIVIGLIGMFVGKASE